MNELISFLESLNNLFAGRTVVNSSFDIVLTTAGFIIDEDGIPYIYLIFSHQQSTPIKFNELNLQKLS